MDRQMIQGEIEMLAQHVADLTRVHAGRLSALTIAVPVPATPGLRRAVEVALSVAGIDFVDVTLKCDDGPVRVLKFDYEV